MCFVASRSGGGGGATEGAVDIPSTTAPMTWWTLPSFWLAWVLARRWTAGAKGLTAGAAGRSAAARRDLATPLWEEKSSASGSMASRRGGGVLLEHDGGVYGEIWVERRERCSLREVDRQGRGLRFRSGELARSEKRTALPDACLGAACNAISASVSGESTRGLER